jgi:hypothetical protein
VYRTERQHRGSKTSVRGIVFNGRQYPPDANPKHHTKLSSFFLPASKQFGVKGFWMNLLPAGECRAERMRKYLDPVDSSIPANLLRPSKID